MRKIHFKILSYVIVFTFILSVSVVAKVDTTMSATMPDVYVVEPKTEGFDSTNKEKTYPVILYIPSSESSIDVYSKLSTNSFDLRLLSKISDDLDFPFYVVIPKKFENAINELKYALEVLPTYYSIDKNRVFVSGCKDGADKAITIASDCSEKIAGYVITSPSVLPDKSRLENLKLQAGWIFGCSFDSNLSVAKTLHETIKSFKTDLYNDNIAVPVNVIFTEFAVSEYVNTVYLDDNVVSFMLRYPAAFTENIDLGTPNGTAGSVSVDGREMKYYLRFPRGKEYPSHGKNIAEKLPLIVDLHGSGGETAVEGMIDGTQADYGMEHLRANVDCDYFRVFPRLPEWGYQAQGGHSTKWGSCATHIKAMIEQIAKEYYIDMDRIYLTGFSLGGYGTWDVAIQYPDLFAAIAPCAGDIANIDELFKISYIPVHIYHGITDPVVSYAGALKPFYRLKQLGAHVVLTSENSGHVLSTTMRSEGAAQWLLQFKKGDIHIPSIAIITKVKFNKLKNTEDIISGKTDPYIKVVVKKDGKIVASERADESGNFIVMMDKMLKAGDKYELCIVNIYGSESEKTIMTVLDKKGPGKIKGLKYLSKKLLIKGTSEKYAKVVVATKKGKVIVSKKLGKKKKFIIRLKRKSVKKYIKKGSLVKVFAFDKAGNKGVSSKLKI